MTALHQNAGIGVDQRRPFREHLRRFNISADDRLKLKRALKTLEDFETPLRQALKGHEYDPPHSAVCDALKLLVRGIDGEFGS